MAYNASYESDDIAEGVINMLVKGLITVGSFAVLIVVIFLYGYVKKRLV